MKIQIYSKTLTAIVLGASIFSVNGCVHYIDTPIVSEKTAETLKTESISKDNSASSEQMPDEETEETKDETPPPPRKEKRCDRFRRGTSGKSCPGGFARLHGYRRREYACCRLHQ